MYGPGPVPFNDGYTVASMDMSTEYEVILLTSEGPKGRCIAKKSEAKSRGIPHLAKTSEIWGTRGPF